jgi:hypothetical protein
MTKSKRRLSTDDILKSTGLIEKEVEVEQWGGSVMIREFSKGRQQQIRKEASVSDEIDVDKLELLMFIHGVIDPVFSEQDYYALREKSAMAIDKVLKEIMAISGLGEKDIKEAEKKFRT